MTKYYAKMDVFINDESNTRSHRKEYITPLRSGVKETKTEILKCVVKILKEYKNNAVISPNKIYIWRSSHTNPKLHGRYVLNLKTMRFSKAPILFDIRKQKSAV